MKEASDEAFYEEEVLDRAGDRTYEAGAQTGKKLSWRDRRRQIQSYSLLRKNSLIFIQESIVTSFKNSKNSFS